MKKILTAILLSLLLATPVNADLLGVKWRAHAPFTVTIVSSLTTPILKSTTATAAATWSQSSVLDVVIGPAPRKGPTVYISEGDDGPTGIGHTYISNQNGIIKSVSIRLNTWYVVSDEVWAMVTCHEIGHALGLDEPSNPDPQNDPTCMAGSGSLPNASDYADLELQYGR